MTRTAPSLAPNSVDAGGLADSSWVASRLGMSARTFRRRRSLGEVLDPLRPSGRPRWLRKEVELWIAEGCPPAEVWRKRRTRWVNAFVT